MTCNYCAYSYVVEKMPDMPLMRCPAIRSMCSGLPRCGLELIFGANTLHQFRHSGTKFGRKMITVVWVMMEIRPAATDARVKRTHTSSVRFTPKLAHLCRMISHYVSQSLSTQWCGSDELRCLHHGTDWWSLERHKLPTVGIIAHTLSYKCVCCPEIFIHCV